MEYALQEETVAVASQPKLMLPVLRPGEIYVGAIISADGSRSHHIILLPGDHDDANWNDAKAWTESIGGELPDRVESALMFATMKDEFKPDWYWTRTQHASYSAYAWVQYFTDGSQDYGRQSLSIRARAVRRLEI